MYQQSTLNCKGRLLSLDTPRVMGILNVTPDSFFDGGRYTTLDAVLEQVERVNEEGADLIDVGGMSSRPGAKIISTEEELQRVLPIVEAISQYFPNTIISVDTVKAAVAKAAVETGARLVNDVSAGSIDEEMHEMVAALQVPYILMHAQGRPETMQHHPTYEEVTLEVLDFFIAKVGKLRALGVKDIVLDVGFGFGKTIAHNYQLLQQLKVFQILGLPILAGLSRKSMIYKVLQTTPEHALHGTIALNMVALQQGAKILRVHDVKAAKETIALWQQLQLADNELIESKAF